MQPLQNRPIGRDELAAFRRRLPFAIGSEACATDAHAALPRALVVPYSGGRDPPARSPSGSFPRPRTDAGPEDVVGSGHGASAQGLWADRAAHTVLDRPLGEESGGSWTPGAFVMSVKAFTR